MIYPKLSDGTIDWCVMCKHEGRDLYDGCCECEYPENSDDPPTKYEQKTMTNGDRIRSMSDEELAAWIDGSFKCADWCDTSKFPNGDCMEVPCLGCIIDWLRQEAQPC